MSFTLSIVIGVCIIWSLIPVVLGIVSSLGDFYTRGRVSLSLGRDFLEAEARSFDTSWDDAALFLHVVLPVIVGGFSLIADKHGLWLELGMVGVVCILLILPRYFLDLCNALKYSFKSRKSEEVEDLKDRLRKLEESSK